MKRLLFIFLFAGAIYSTQAEVLTLDSCLNAARQRNCTIQSALLDVQISQQVKKQVFTKYFPQVNLVGFGFYAIEPLIKVYIPGLMQTPQAQETLEFIFEAIKEDHPDFSDEFQMLKWGATVGGSVIQPIFMGGRIVNGNKLAKLGIEASEKKVEISERDILQEVEDTYWLVAGLYEKRETITRVKQLLDTIDTVAQTAFASGLVTRNDLLKVALKRNEIETKSVQLEDGILLASRALCQLTGIDYSEELELEPFPEDNAVETFVLMDTFTVSGRPEAELLSLNIQAEQLRKKMLVGEALPQIGIGFQGGYNNFFERDRWNGLGFAFVRIPLTQWWETGHKIKEQNLKIAQAQMMQKDLMEKMSLQNEQAYNQLNEAARMVMQSQSAMDMAQDNYDLSLMNYQAGLATMSDLLESQALLLQAQNNYTDARISYRAAQRKFNSYNK